MARRSHQMALIKSFSFATKPLFFNTKEVSFLEGRENFLPRKQHFLSEKMCLQANKNPLQAQKLRLPEDKKNLLWEKRCFPARKNMFSCQKKMFSRHQNNVRPSLDIHPTSVGYISNERQTYIQRSSDIIFLPANTNFPALKTFLSIYQNISSPVQNKPSNAAKRVLPHESLFLW